MPDEVKTFLQAPPAQYRSHFIFKNLALASPEPLTLDNISKTFSRVAEAMQNQDVQKLTFLFMISSHGANKVVSLHPSPNQNELISTDQLATWINALPCQNITVLMDACQSGTFIDVTYNNTKKCYQTAQNFGLLDPKAMKKGSQRLVIVSACNIELSRPDIDYALPNAPGENNEDRGSEFLGGFIEAFANPLADKNPQDGMISLGEAFDFAYKYACYAGITHPNPTFKDANHPYFRLVLRGSSQTYVYDPEKKAKILYQEYLFK